MQTRGGNTDKHHLCRVLSRSPCNVIWKVNGVVGSGVSMRFTSQSTVGMEAACM